MMDLIYLEVSRIPFEASHANWITGETQKSSQPNDIHLQGLERAEADRSNLDRWTYLWHLCAP